MYVPGDNKAELSCGKGKGRKENKPAKEGRQVENGRQGAGTKVDQLKWYGRNREAGKGGGGNCKDKGVREGRYGKKYIQYSKDRK